MSEQGADVSKDDEGGMATTILVGLLILGFAGWFLFGRSDGQSGAHDAGKNAAGALARTEGSIAARGSDPARRANRDPAASPQSRGLVTAEPEAEPRTREEKIARAERDLRRAKDRLTRIERGVERFDESRARAVEKAPNAAIKEAEYDRKEENMAKNLELTKTKIEELEDVLANLRSGEPPTAAAPAPLEAERADPAAPTPAAADDDTEE